MSVTAITTDLLRSCIKVDGGSPEKLEERKRTMPLKNVKCLIFSFKGIRTINWLQGLHSLTKLYLDNNDICKIENLSHLKALKYLDLSINKIQKIEGLEELESLEDLSLYGNQIDKIVGLEGLQKISSLSLGRNKLKRLEDILPLRKLRNLHVLTLDGNPVASDPEYRLYVISHMRDVTYFDHRYVEKAEVNAAREQYQDDMTEIKQKEQEEDALRKEAEEHEQKQALYTISLEVLKLKAASNLLGCDTLFARMVNEDPEYPRLFQVPGLLNSMDEYKDKYETATEEIITGILAEFKKKQEEVELWQFTTTALLDARDTESRLLVKSLRKLKKKIFAEVRQDTTRADEKFAILKEENDKLREKLLELEMLTFGEVQDIWYSFDTNYSAIVEGNKIQFQTYFGTIRMSENNCSETVTAQASLLMEQFSLGELEVDSDEGRMMLRDKDMLLNAIQASHDARTLKIDSLEDQRLRGEENMQKDMNKAFRLGENRRNRERIEEIDFVHQTTLDEISEFISNLESDASVA